MKPDRLKQLEDLLAEAYQLSTQIESMMLVEIDPFEQRKLQLKLSQCSQRIKELEREQAEVEKSAKSVTNPLAASTSTPGFGLRSTQSSGPASATQPLTAPSRLPLRGRPSVNASPLQPHFDKIATYFQQGRLVAVLGRRLICVADLPTKFGMPTASICPPKPK